MQHPPDNLLAPQDHLLPRHSPYREDLNIFDQSTWHPRAGADMEAVWETNSVLTAPSKHHREKSALFSISSPI